jgi:CDP-diacylglycerol--serine O-phosphatidyltransferase
MYTAFLIPVFSAVRLAKFNNDPRQSDSFIGLPTPANAIFCCSLPLIIDKTVSNNIIWVNVICNVYTLCILSCLLSLLLISEIPLFALKFKNFSWTDNKLRFIFLGISLALLIAFKFVGIPIAIILYIVLSIVTNFTSKSNAVA